MEQKYRDYSDFIEDAQAYNSLLFAERKLRLPFIDSQTGIAQRDCSLWRSQRERNNCNGRTGTLYSYPPLKWQKRRREYLMKSSLPAQKSEQQQANQWVRTSGTRATTSFTNSRLGHPNEQTYSSQQSNQNSSSSNSQNSAASTPTCADSSSSHEIYGPNSQDSDAKNQLQLATSLPLRDGSPPGDHGGEPTSVHRAVSCLSEPLGGRRRFTGTQGPLNGLAAKRSHREQQQQFEAQTKAAIRLHSKKSKKKDAGHSLMRTNNGNNDNNNSILIKNGQYRRDLNATIMGDDDHDHDDHEQKINPSDRLNNSTARGGRELVGGTNNNNVIEEETLNYDVNESSQRKSGTGVNCLRSKAIITNGSRPYVCSICDQTYKTRPGLSYHFLHTHKTSLPKNLPNIRIVAREGYSKVNSASNSSNADANFIGSTKVNASKTRRELESTQARENLRLLRSGRVMRSQEQSCVDEENNDDDGDQTEEENYGDIDQANSESGLSKTRNENHDQSEADHLADPSESSKGHEEDRLTPFSCNNSEVAHSKRTSDTEPTVNGKMAVVDEKRHPQSDDNLFEIYRKQNGLAPNQVFDDKYIKFHAKLAAEEKSRHEFDSSMTPINSFIL